MKRLRVDAARCTGCALCMRACSLRRTGACGPRGAAIRVARDEFGRREAPLVCLLCEDRACVQACPTGALRAGRRRLLLDGASCTACGACAAACPFGLLHGDAGRPVPCDLCGGHPACVRHCPSGALSFVAETAHWPAMRRTYLELCRCLGVVVERA